MPDQIIPLEDLRAIVDFDEERAGLLNCVGRAWKVMAELRDRMQRIAAKRAAKPTLLEPYWAGALTGTADETPITQAAVDSLYATGSAWLEGVEAIQAVRPMFPGMPLPQVEPETPVNVPIMEVQ